METNFNLGSLKVVKSFLEEYIQKSIENIDKNIEIIGVQKKQPDDYIAIEFLDKLYKTLDIIGLKGLAKLFYISNEGILYVKSGKSNLVNSLEILKKSKQIIEKSKIYLNKIVDSGFDQPTKFFNDYKQLAELIEVKVSIKDLFYPRLELKSDFNQTIQKDLRFGIFVNENIKKYLKIKLSENLEGLKQNVFSLNEKIKNIGNSETNEIELIHNLCHQIYEDLDFLQKIKINRNSYIFFGLSKLYVCCLSPKFNEHINSYANDNRKYILNILNNTLLVVEGFKDFIENSSSGDKTSSFRLENSYIQDLLFEMKIIKNNQALVEMPIFKQTESFFDLNYYLDQIDEASAFMDFNDEENLLSNEIKSLFVEIKSLAEILVNESNYTENRANDLIQKIKQMSVYLENHPSIKKLAEQIIIFINIENKENINFSQELSLGVILLEHGINNYINETVDPRSLKDFEDQVDIQIERFSSFNTEVNQLPIPKINAEDNLSKVFEDYNKKLKNIEESLDYFLKNNGENIDEISILPKILSEIKGIFVSIDKQEMLKVIDFILVPWGEIIQKQSLDVNMLDLQESVEFLGGISLMVKAYSDDNAIEADEIYENIVSKFHKIKLIDDPQTVENVFLSNNDIESSFDFQNMDNKEEVIKSFSGEEYMNSEKEESIINNLSNGDWPLLKELETTRFAIKNKKKKDIDLNVAVVEETIEENIQADLRNEPISESPTNILESKELEVNNSIDNNYDSEENITSKEEIYEVSWVSDSTNDPELAEIFLIEAQEVFENLEKDFEILNDNINNKESLTNIRRFYHTLKGSGRMVGLKYMGEVAWMVEQTLNRCVSDELTFNQDILDSVIETTEKFKEWIGDLQINNLVNLDIVQIKNKLLQINSELKNSFEVSNEENKIINDTEKNIETEISEIVDNSGDIQVTQDSEISNDLEIIEEKSSKDNLELPSNSEIFVDEKSEDNNELENNIDFINDEPETKLDLANIEVETLDVIEEDVVIDNTKIKKQDYDNFNIQSDAIINSFKNIINISFEEPIILDQEFINLAQELSEISSLIGLSKITKLANHIESVAITANNMNIGLSQTSVNKLRHVVDNLDIFKSVEASDHVAFYESLREILVLLEKEILEFETITELEENTLEEEIDMEKIAQIKLELQEEIKNILEEKNSLIKNVLDKLESTQAENESLIEKISNLEEGFENFKANQEQKEKMFIKALEVNRNDIKVLVDLIKKM